MATKILELGRALDTRAARLLAPRTGDLDSAIRVLKAHFAGYFQVASVEDEVQAFFLREGGCDLARADFVPAANKELFTHLLRMERFGVVQTRLANFSSRLDSLALALTGPNRRSGGSNV